MKKTAFLFSALSCCAILFPAISLANNLTITNVHMGPRNPSTKTVSVVFDASWENSWRNKINHDAVWLTVRLNDIQNDMTDRRLCQISVVGINPAGTSRGTSSDLELYVPQDKAGAFLRPSQNAEKGTVATVGVTLPVNYGTCGFTESTQIAVTVVGMEMVLVPAGSFYAGDFAVSSASLRQGSGDNDPWEIATSSAISVTNAGADAFYYVSAGQTGETSTGAVFTIPSAFPKGYGAFYLMKYEITEGQWVEFLNSLPTDVARSAHDLTDNLHKNSDAVVSRNTISCSGSPLVCASARPSRPVTFLSWTDLAAFLDWAALRPMTELEFEKAARGPFVPVKGEYAWGTTSIGQAETISGTAEEGDETVTNVGASANFGAVVFSGGDSENGVEYQSGALRTGIFATSTSDRLLSGAGNYGALELSGNVKEWVVTIGHAQGLTFTGLHGNGLLTSSGHADVAGWPGMNADLSLGITGASGAGFRGGSWADSSDNLRISDRTEAAQSAEDALATYGGRGVRTVDVN